MITPRRPRVAAGLTALALTLAACADAIAPDRAQVAPPLVATMETMPIEEEKSSCPGPFASQGPYMQPGPVEDRNANGWLCAMTIYNEESGVKMTILIDDHITTGDIGRCHEKMTLVDAPRSLTTGEYDAVDKNLDLKKCHAKKARPDNTLEDVYADNNLK